VHAALRTSLATLGLVVMLGAPALWAATRPSSAPGGTPSPDPGGPVLVVGDSLAVGLHPSLDRLLRPRRVVWDAVNGRTTPQGMAALRSALRRVDPAVVVLSLGTNDGPDPERFASRIRRTLAAIPADACVLWASVFRPPRKGPYAGLNRVLRRHARRDPRLLLVDWRRAVARGAVALPDGLHPDAAGFRHRSRMVAAALARGCG
jgi:lysophospholipase L1-like esterase